MLAIQTHKLSKTYNSGKEALRGLSLSVAAGTVFGFLGPNGAGKTTAVKLMSGLLSPTAGESQVLGLDPARQAVALHALCGVVTEHAQMYDYLTGSENLHFYGQAFGLSLQDSKARAAELLNLLQLADARDNKLGTYSTGMRQRLSLARALMHRPRLLFLDEPTAGLDPESTLQVNRLIARLSQEEGCTVFLCTHQLRYAQEICASYGLISEGRLLALGSLDELRQAVLPGIRVEIHASIAPQHEGARQIAEGQYELQLSTQAEIPPLVRGIVQDGGDVYQVLQERPSLEAIYFALTGGKEQCHAAR